MELAILNWGKSPISALIPGYSEPLNVVIVLCSSSSSSSSSSRSSSSNDLFFSIILAINKNNTET